MHSSVEKESRGPRERVELMPLSGTDSTQNDIVPFNRGATIYLKVWECCTLPLHVLLCKGRRCSCCSVRERFELTKADEIWCEVLFPNENDCSEVGTESDL
jgi:hypothetical protein